MYCAFCSCFIITTGVEWEELCRMHKKLIRSEVHASTLLEYCCVQRIPRGLRILKEPGMCRDNHEFVGIWNEILNKCSQDLMILIIETSSKINKKLGKKTSTGEHGQIQTTSNQRGKNGYL